MSSTQKNSSPGQLGEAVSAMPPEPLDLRSFSGLGVPYACGPGRAKFLIPEAIPGPATLDNIHNQHIRLEVLDQKENPMRIRLKSTVVRVEHLGKPENADVVQVTYTQNGKLWHLRARHVVMASGGWVNRHIVRDLPDANRAAYTRFHHSSTLVVNVALTNWRFLYKLGITGGRWFDGLGYTANIRQQMTIGDNRPRLHPDSPNVMTFYIPSTRREGRSRSRLPRAAQNYSGPASVSTNGKSVSR